MLEGERPYVRTAVALVSAIGLGAGGLLFGAVLMFLALPRFDRGVGMELTSSMQLVVSLVFVQGVGCIGVAAAYVKLRPRIAPAVRDPADVSGTPPRFRIGLCAGTARRCRRRPGYGLAFASPVRRRRPRVARPGRYRYQPGRGGSDGESGDHPCYSCPRPSFSSAPARKRCSAASSRAVCARSSTLFPAFSSRAPSSPDSTSFALTGGSVAGNLPRPRHPSSGRRSSSARATSTRATSSSRRSSTDSTTRHCSRCSTWLSSSVTNCRRERRPRSHFRVKSCFRRLAGTSVLRETTRNAQM